MALGPVLAPNINLTVDPTERAEQALLNVRAVFVGVTNFLFAVEAPPRRLES